LVSQIIRERVAVDLEALVRPSARAVGQYQRQAAPTDTPPRTVRLDWNESPYGASPRAREAIARVDHAHRYPDIEATELRDALGRYLGMPAEQIVAGAGLDDVFTTIAMLLIEPGDEVIISEPTFGLYRSLFSLHGATVTDVPLETGFRLDVERLLVAIQSRTKLVIICNPNNPTGTLFDLTAIERIAAEAGCLVAIDEAYAEFAGVAHVPLMTLYDNVAVLRTMSKFAGLAGLRVGYGAFPEQLMPHLRRVMPAFCNISAISASAAVASLEDTPHLQAVVATIVADRDALATALHALPGVMPLPSATNFLLVRLPVVDAAPVVAELARRGVFVRHFPRPDLGIADCLRVTVGTPRENQIFLAELADVLQRGVSS